MLASGTRSPASADTGRPALRPIRASGQLELASDLGCDAVAGHSIGGNLALEMVATGEFSGPVALLEPAFSREGEFNELAILDRIGRVSRLGHLAWVASLKTIGM